MFEQEVQQALDYVARGINVRIVGQSGSGRTSVAKRVAESLEKSGATVHFLTGLRTHRRVAFGGVNSVVMDVRVGSLGVLGVADVFTAHLLKPGLQVVIVDDIEFIDNESLAVLEAALARTGRPLVVTMGEPRMYSSAQATAVSRGPEAEVQLNPLRYEQAGELISQALGAPADANVIARILAKSAGNPRLIVRIVETAILSNQLKLHNGNWALTSDALWNDHLRGTVETLLEGLGAEEINALHAMALAGATPLEALQDVIHPDVLDALERRGFVSLMEDQYRVLTAAINPPIIADYFGNHSKPNERRILRKRIARVLNALPYVPGGDAAEPNPLDRVLRDIRSESNTDAAATARHFQDRIHMRERAFYDRWEADRSLTNAIPVLRTYWGSPIDSHRISIVLDHTQLTSGSPIEALFFTMTKALWGIHSGQNVHVAASGLRELGRRHPELINEVEMAALFLQATYDRVPPDLQRIFSNNDAGHRHGISAVVRGMIELYRFNPTAALAAVDSVADSDVEPFPRIRPFIRAMALFASGRAEEALFYALERRTEARRALDQFGVVTSSYAAAQSLVYLGYLDEAEYLMSGVFAMGRPGLLIDSLYDAMLRLAGLKTATTAPVPAGTLASHAKRGAADIGPLPGTGKGVFDLISKRPVDPEAFDRRAARLIKRQIDQGFVLEAVMCALLCTCLLPGRKVVELLRTALQMSDTPSHGQLMAMATAVVGQDHRSLGALVNRYEPDDDLYAVGMLLRGAFTRCVLLNDLVLAAAMDRAYSAFANRFPALNDVLSFSPGDYMTLTVREIEVAALAGHRSNVEIAQQLGISTRTVENHISNALRKTGAATRNSLFELVRDLYSSQ